LIGQRWLRQAAQKRDAIGLIVIALLRIRA